MFRPFLLRRILILLSCIHRGCFPIFGDFSSKHSCCESICHGSLAAFWISDKWVPNRVTFAPLIVHNSFIFYVRVYFLSSFKFFHHFTYFVFFFFNSSLGCIYLLPNFTSRCDWMSSFTFNEIILAWKLFSVIDWISVLLNIFSFGMHLLHLFYFII